MLMEGGVVHGCATSGCGPGGKFSAFNMGRPTVYKNVTRVTVMPPWLTGTTASLANSSPGQKSVPEMVVQEYPECAENATVNGFDAVEAAEEVCAGADDMLPPPQALHANKQASARMVPPAKLFMGLPPEP